VLLIEAWGRAFALDCIIEGSKGAVKVEWSNKEVNEFQQKASSNCEGAKILQGEANIYFEDDSGASRVEQLQIGQVVSSASLNASHGGRGPIALVITQINRILHGDKIVVRAQTRGEDASQLMGFPYKVILLPIQKLKIELDNLKTHSLDFFSLVNEKALVKPIFYATKINNEITIDAALIERGESYRWTAKNDLKEFQGEFRVAGINEENEIKSYLDETVKTNPSLSTLGKALAEAGVYNQYGFEFDGIRVLREAINSESIVANHGNNTETSVRQNQ
jgi:hypothetical protein